MPRLLHGGRIMTAAALPPSVPTDGPERANVPRPWLAACRRGLAAPVNAAARPAATGPAIEQLGGAVLVRGQALSRILFGIGRGIDAAHHAGRTDLVAELRWYADIFQCAAGEAVSPQRHSDVATTAPAGRFDVCERDWISVSEAAKRAGKSTRQVQRVAHRLAQKAAARRVGRTWSLDPIAFALYLNDRSTHLGDNTND